MVDTLTCRQPQQESPLQLHQQQEESLIVAALERKLLGSAS